MDGGGRQLGPGSVQAHESHRPSGRPAEMLCDRRVPLSTASVTHTRTRKNTRTRLQLIHRPPATRGQASHGVIISGWDGLRRPHALPERAPVVQLSRIVGTGKVELGKKIHGDRHMSGKFDTVP